MEIVERISDGRRSPALTWIKRRDEGFSLARRRHRDRSTTHIEQLVPPLGLSIGPVLDLPPLNAAPVGIALALGNDILEVVLFHRCHERLAATIDRHGFGDQVIGAPVRRRLSRFFRSTSGNGRRSLPLSQSRSKATKHGSLRRRRSTKIGRPLSSTQQTSPSKTASVTRRRLASAAASGSRCLKRLRLRETRRAPGSVNLEQRAEAVLFELEEPIRIVEGVGAALQHERRQLWERIGHGCG